MSELSRYLAGGGSRNQSIEGAYRLRIAVIDAGNRIRHHQLRHVFFVPCVRPSAP